MEAGDYEGTWPIAKFHFEVEIDDTPISFQEVSGLESETQVIEYRHGDSEVFSVNKSAGLIKTSNLVCKKGVFAGDEEVLEIWKQIIEAKAYYSEGERLEITVTLLDEQSEPVMSWNITGAFPIKYSGTDLKSDANEVAIESIEFAYEEIEVEFE